MRDFPVEYYEVIGHLVFTLSKIDINRSLTGCA